MVDTDWYTLDPVTTRFGSFCQSIMSKVDAEKQQAAVDYITALQTTDLEPGTGLASTLLFIYESAWSGADPGIQDVVEEGAYKIWWQSRIWIH